MPACQDNTKIKNFSGFEAEGVEATSRLKTNGNQFMKEKKR